MQVKWKVNAKSSFAIDKSNKINFATSIVISKRVQFACYLAPHTSTGDIDLASSKLFIVDNLLSKRRAQETTNQDTPL